MLFEEGHTILFSRYTMTSAHISIIPEFRTKIELIGATDFFSITKTSITCLKTGSKIIFKGIRTSSGDQSANLKSLQGVTTFILDEAEELIDEDIFDKISLSIREPNKQNRIILIMNPASKVHWIYKRFFEQNGVQPGSNLIKDDVTYIHTTYLDNYNNLDTSFIKSVEKLKETNLEKFNHQIMGGWLDVADGVIFSNWEYGEFPDTNDYIYGMDFGFDPDPDVLTKIYINKYEKKIYIDEVIYNNRLSTHELIQMVKQETNSKLVVADNQANRLIDELKRGYVNIKPCVKGAGSIAEGIKLLQDYTLVLTPKSKNIAKEFNNYVWNSKRAGVPKDMYNHACDSIRYAVTHLLVKPEIKKIKIY